MQLGHIAVSVSDMDRSAKFYRRWFGLKLAKKYRHPGLTIALLKGPFTLELFQFSKRKPLPRYRRKLDSDLRTLGVKHFSVETEDIEKLYLGLKRARVPFAVEMSVFDNGAHYFFIKDPDSILIEVMEA